MSEIEKSSKLQNLEKISKSIGGHYSAEQLGIIKANVAKGTTDGELAYFASVCHSVGLNPLNKEVWCYKDHKNNLIIFTGRDGLLRKAQENPNFNGIRSAYVCENDAFEMDIANAKIKHSQGLTDRGIILGAYAIAFRKDGEPTIEWVRLSDYLPAKASPYSPWKRFTGEMIKKVAESHALKKAFGLTGVQVEYDYEVVGDHAYPKGQSQREKIEDKEYQQIKDYIATASDGMELSQVPDEKLERYPDLRQAYDEKMDYFMTENIESDEV